MPFRRLRVDYPETDPNQRYYQATGGLDKLWVRRDWITDAIATPPVQTIQTTPSVSKLGACHDRACQP